MRIEGIRVTIREVEDLAFFGKFYSYLSLYSISSYFSLSRSELDSRFMYTVDLCIR